MKQLKDVQNQVRAAFAGESIRCDIPQVIAGLVLGDTYHTLDLETQAGRRVVLGKRGFSSLITDHIFPGQFYGLRMMNDPHVSAETKMAILKDRVSSIPDDRSSVILKTNITKHAGLAVTDAVVGGNEPIVANWDVVDALMEIKGGLLPDDIQVESSYIQPSGRYMQLRLISEAGWTFRVNGDPYYGAFVVENNELTTSFSASSACQKLACINYAIGDHVADHSLKWGGYSEFREVLAGGAGKLSEAFEFMRGRHENMLAIEVRYPGEFMAMILAELKIKDQKTISAANDHLLSGDSMDDVLQAITFATQHITSRSRLNQWTRRATLEGAVWNALGVNAVNQVNEGVAVDDLYMNDDLRLRDAISAFLKIRSAGYTGEASKALSLSADMVFDVEVE